MDLVGWSDLQGRSAYQPLVHKQGDRLIAYIGHHGGTALNPLTGKQEDNGTSIVDVTNPKQPKYLAHIPGDRRPGRSRRRADGARLRRQHAAARGQEQGLPAAQLRRAGPRNLGRHAIRPKPSRLTVVVSGLRDTHKSWWECDTGIAYLVGRRARLAHAAHDDDLRPERSGQAGVHPQLRLAGPAARLDGSRADRPARADFDRAERQPRVLRLRHRRQRHRCRSSIATSS